MSRTRVDEILASILARQPRQGSLPDALCAACASALPISGVGLALMTEQGHVGLVSATDARATTMEDLQFGLGEGPCIDASTRGRPVLQPELRRSGPTRWPAFGPAAVEAGIEAIFAFPLQVGAIRLGVLDLYRDTAGPLAPAAFTEALAYADAAVRVLLHLQDEMPLDGGLHPDLGRAPGRPEVHQATGMIAVQSGVRLADALLLLRARAYSSGTSVTQVALDVVSRALRFDPETAHDG